MKKAFTLPEVLLAVSIFSVISTIAASLYVQSFRQTRRANLENQVYEDARYVLQLIADEVREGMIDYDEYYSQNVVIPLSSAPAGGPGLGIDNFGQNYGRYYSSFFHSGTKVNGDYDGLGFDCNDGTRNARTCTPIRGTVDRNTGTNPYAGKPASSTPPPGEDAFCGKVEYGAGGGLVNPSGCDADASVKAVLDRLYLINADASRKTILAREQIGLIPGASAGTPVYALSILRLKGFDTNRDGKFDSFICAPEFECRGTDDVSSVGDENKNLNGGDKSSAPDALCTGEVPTERELPRKSGNAYADLATYTDTAQFALETQCDPKEQAFYKDFIPLSPLRVNVSSLNFIITPAENPHYAFAEDAAQIQPRVTITLTVEPNSDMVGSTESFTPITLTETVSTRILTPIPAPKLDI